MERPHESHARPPEPPRKPKPPVRPGDAIDLGRGCWAAKSAVIFSFSRSRGPGGQNVNKVNTRAEVHLAIAAIVGLDDAARARLHDLAGSRLVGGDTLHVDSDAHRSQFENREACLARLRELVTAAATPPKRRKKTRPTRGSVERRLEGKRRDSDRKRNRGWRGE